MTVNVVFKLTKAANARAAVVLRDEGTGGLIKLVFDPNGKAGAKLDPVALYTVMWALVGAMGDAIQLNWSTANNSGSPVNSSITPQNSIPYPGNRFRAEDMGFMGPVGQ